jgi:hypothetical protein
MRKAFAQIGSIAKVSLPDGTLDFSWRLCGQQVIYNKLGSTNEETNRNFCVAARANGPHFKRVISMGVP